MLTTAFTIVGLGSLFALAVRAVARDCQPDPNDPESVRAYLAENQARQDRREARARARAALGRRGWLKVRFDADLKRMGDALEAAYRDVAREYRRADDNAREADRHAREAARNADLAEGAGRRIADLEDRLARLEEENYRLGCTVVARAAEIERLTADLAEADAAAVLERECRGV